MDYEASIISAMLNHTDEINKHDLCPDDFSDNFLSITFSAMQKLSANGVGIDFFVIAKEIGRNDAVADLSKIQRDTSFAVKNIPLYVKQLKEKHFTKKIKAQLTESLKHIDSEKPASEIVSNLISVLSSLNDGDADHAYKSKQMVSMALNHIEEAFDRKASGLLAGVTTGMKKLDDELGGFHDSDLVIVGARPAVGKTSFLLSCAYRAAKKGHKVGIISTEMSVTQLGVRLMSLSSEVNASTMRDSSYTDNDWSRITSGTGILKDLPIYIYDNPVCKVSDISMQVRAWQAEHGIDIVFVDYLTRVRPESGSENRTIAVGNIATDLKTLARTMNIPVVVLAQLSRDLEKRPSKIPMMSDLRDSGVIEQEADQVLMLYRDIIYNPDAREDGANIIIEKNRHGATSFLNMRFKPQTMEWCDEEEFYNHK